MPSDSVSELLGSTAQYCPCLEVLKLEASRWPEEGATALRWREGAAAVAAMLEQRPIRYAHVAELEGTVSVRGGCTRLRCLSVPRARVELAARVAAPRLRLLRAQSVRRAASAAPDAEEHFFASCAAALEVAELPEQEARLEPLLAACRRLRRLAIPAPLRNGAAVSLYYAPRVHPLQDLCATVVRHAGRSEFAAGDERNAIAVILHNPARAAAPRFDARRATNWYCSGCGGWNWNSDGGGDNGGDNDGVFIVPLAWARSPRPPDPLYERAAPVGLGRCRPPLTPLEAVLIDGLPRLEELATGGVERWSSSSRGPGDDDHAEGDDVYLAGVPRGLLTRLRFVRAWRTVSSWNIARRLSMELLRDSVAAAGGGELSCAARAALDLAPHWD